MKMICIGMNVISKKSSSDEKWMEKNMVPPLKQTAFNSHKALDQNNECEEEKKKHGKKTGLSLNVFSIFYSLSFESSFALSVY